MKILLSLCLWAIGGSFFLMSFCILFFCLLFLRRQTVYQIARVLFGIQIRLMGIKLTVTGQENICPDNSYLIMGNHQSLFDIFVVPAAMPLCFVGVEAAYHFKVPVWGYLIRKWGCIPIERNNLKNAISSLETAKKTLLSGMSIGILPEGHRTLTGEMASFKKGPFHLARGARADILPFAIKGLFDYHQKGRILLKPGRVSLTIGKPIPYDTVKNLSIDKLRDLAFDSILTLFKK